jgi:Putative lumazine-binding
MRRFLITLTAILACINISQAQSAGDSVKAAVNKLFEGMKNSDAGMIRASFADSAILQTIARNQEGDFVIRNENVNDFAESIATIKKGAADERIEFETIRVDGPLAVVWTPYQFYFDGKFSHCGVNSFQLVRLKGEWKIQYIIDTRRRQGCQ